MRSSPAARTTSSATRGIRRRCLPRCARWVIPRLKAFRAGPRRPDRQTVAAGVGRARWRHVRTKRRSESWRLMFASALPHTSRGRSGKGRIRWGRGDRGAIGRGRRRGAGDDPDRGDRRARLGRGVARAASRARRRLHRSGDAFLAGAGHRGPPGAGVRDRHPRAHPLRGTDRGRPRRVDRRTSGRRSSSRWPRSSACRPPTIRVVRPIFALPGGRGDARQLYALARLAREIDPARPLYAFPGDPPVPESTPPQEWIAAAAAAVAARVRATQPTGPHLLLGVCAGGVIAWEAACQLEAAGEVVHLLLVDTRNPQWTLGEGTFRHAVTESLTPGERRARHRRRREWRRARSVDTLLPPVVESPDEERVTRRLMRSRAYRPRPLRGRVTLLVNGDWHQVGSALGWEGLAAGGIDGCA